MMHAALAGYFRKHLPRIERELNRALPSKSISPRIIHDAMRYSALAGGKRLRPILVIAGAEACGGKAKSVLPVACALELIHAYSLIHDDLPAMDDDDLRRGKPTNHKVYGEDIAILAGDALLTRAFGLLADARVSAQHSDRAVKTISVVAEAAGTLGMVGGQVADIQADQGRWKKMKGTEFSSAGKLLAFIHHRKTGALIRASLVAGATMAGGKPKAIAALDEYGRCLGLLFQITDDILDVTADKQKLGKRGSDEKNKKLTYVTLYGLKLAQQHANTLEQKARQALKPFGDEAETLRLLARYVLTRDH